MKLVLPKDDYSGKIDLFLAGGISNCPDWQTDAALTLETMDELVVANPRRSEGLEKTGVEAAKQIAWEHDALKRADTILFWFPEETLCPITLFELGVQVGKLDKKMFVGAHPNYARRFDIVQQMSLVPHWTVPPKVHDNLYGLLKEVINYHNFVNVQNDSVQKRGSQ